MKLKSPILKKEIGALKPSSEITVSEWAAKYRIMTPFDSPAAGQPFNNDRVPTFFLGKLGRQPQLIHTPIHMNNANITCCNTKAQYRIPNNAAPIAIPLLMIKEIT